MFVLYMYVYSVYMLFAVYTVIYSMEPTILVLRFHHRLVKIIPSLPSSNLTIPVYPVISFYSDI